MGWFAGVVMFFMYRLGGDELKVMEKEAEDRFICDLLIILLESA